MAQSGRVFAPKFTMKLDPPTTSLPKEKSITVASPQEEGVLISIPHNKVTPDSPPKVNDVMNKPTKATPPRKRVVDVEAQPEPYKENISPDENQNSPG